MRGSLLESILVSGIFVSSVVFAIKIEKGFVGGRLAEIREAPWAMALRNRDFPEGDPYCTYCLISEYTAIGSALCIRSAQEGKENWLQSAYLSGGASLIDSGKEYHINKLIVHEEYNPRPLQNDISLVILNEPVSPDVNIRPAVLPCPFKNYEKNDARVVGWGNVQNKKKLHLAEVRIPSESKCRYVVRGRGMLNPEKHICTESSEISLDDADPGMPLIVNEGQSEVVVGVLKRGYNAGVQSIYTAINKYIRWIQSHVVGSVTFV